MRYRELGTSGVQISALGFGCGSIGGLFVRGEPAEQQAAIERALAGGISYFDTAAAYGDGLSEQNLGRALRAMRVDPVVGTKIRLRLEEIEAAEVVCRQRLQEGLVRLGRPQVDVCTLHGWVGGAGNPSAEQVCGPIAAAMRGLVEDGLCRAIGFTAQGERADLVAVVASGTFDYFQCVYSIANPSAALTSAPAGISQDFAGLLGAAHDTATGVMAIRVLAAGALAGDLPLHRLAGQIVRGPDAAIAAALRDQAIARLAAMESVQEAAGSSDLAELAIAFAASHRDVSSVLVGFSDADQVDAALRAVETAPLARSVLTRLHRP